jgi:hypothetical protein
LASSVSNQNPLPVEWVNFNVINSANELHFSWQTVPGIIPDYFEIEYSDDGKRFYLLKKLTMLIPNSLYQYSIKNPSPLVRFYRLKTVYQQLQYYSSIISLNIPDRNIRLHFVSSVVSSNQIILSITASKRCQIIIYIINNLGQIISKTPCQLLSGNQYISLPARELRAGYYQVFGLSSALHTNPLIFIKP